LKETNKERKELIYSDKDKFCPDGLSKAIGLFLFYCTGRTRYFFSMKNMSRRWYENFFRFLPE